jgi:2-dehydropantoate 2-reductase
VVDAVSSLAHRLDRDSQVLLLANGLGFASELSGRYPWLAPYCGTTTEGAYRVSSFRIRHAGHGATRIGRSGEPNPPAWFAPWRALENCLWEQDIDSALWEKLAVNCAINPLTAVHDCRNGELLSRPELAREVDALCNEIASRAAGQGGGSYPQHRQQPLLHAAGLSRWSHHGNRLHHRPVAAGS